MQARIVGGRLVTSGTAAANQTVYAVAASLGIPADHFIELDWLSTVVQAACWAPASRTISTASSCSASAAAVRSTNASTVRLSATPLVSSTTTLAPGDRVRLEAQGQVVRVIRNGSVLMSAALASGEFSRRGRPGILPRTAASNPYGDNLIAGGF